MSNRYTKDDIVSIKERTIFFDANVILYVFWPTGDHHWERVYSSIFNQLYKNGNQLTLDFVVISEIVNRTLRIEYDKYMKLANTNRQEFPFKRFRDSQDGGNVLKEIYTIIQQKILKFFTISGKSITKEDIESFMRIDALDFSDKAIISLCSDKNFVLLTNDKDFKSASVDILSANPQLRK